MLEIPESPSRPETSGSREDGGRRGEKAYHEPRFRVYADLRSLTESKNSSMGKTDGAYGALLKTG